MQQASPSKLAIAILAAGESSRLGQPKALCELPGGLPIFRLLRELRASRISTRTASSIDADALGQEDAHKIRPVLVTGAHHDAIILALQSAGEDARPFSKGGLTLNHQEWSQGRTSSIQRAAHACPGMDLLVVPVDHPRICQDTFDRMATSWEAHSRPSRGWLAPFIRSPANERQFGHPVLIGRELIAELLDWSPDAPLHELRELALPLLAIEVSDPSILENLDTPKDLAAIRKADLADL